MKLRPGVSVILPFYNMATSLDAAIASIADQSFTEWELLLIDNASSDESTVIAKRWVANDDRIRVIQELNIGIAKALNTGLAHAQGRHIARKAQLRLNAKFKRLLARRVMKNKAVVAVARELAGFVWAIGCEVHNSGWQGMPIPATAAAD